MTKMRLLNLAGTNVTDKGIRCIRRFPQLERSICRTRKSPTRGCITLRA